MKVTSHNDADGVTLSLDGDLDLSTVEFLLARIDRETAEPRPTRLVLDLAGVTFCDSTGVAALVDARATATGRGVAFLVTRPYGVTRRVLRITGVLDVLTTTTGS